MRECRCTIILDPDPKEGGYTVTAQFFLDVCVTQGESLEEVIAMSEHAIRLYVESLRADGEAILEACEHPQAIIIEVAA
jgi:predicted RNase H-like HicB family nuclease